MRVLIILSLTAIALADIPEALHLVDNQNDQISRINENLFALEKVVANHLLVEAVNAQLYEKNTAANEIPKNNDNSVLNAKPMEIFVPSVVVNQNNNKIDVNAEAKNAISVAPTVTNNIPNMTSLKLLSAHTSDTSSEIKMSTDNAITSSPILQDDESKSNRIVGMAARLLEDESFEPRMQNVIQPTADVIDISSISSLTSAELDQLKSKIASLVSTLPVDSTVDIANNSINLDFLDETKDPLTNKDMAVNAFTNISDYDNKLYPAEAILNQNL